MVDLAHASPTPPSPTPAGGPPPSHSNLSGSGFPEKYIVFGVFVGLFLTLFGVGILALGPALGLDRASPAAALTTCVGFGIILAAFGARASGSWAGWSAAGAGAMAVLLFLLLQRFSPEPTEQIMKGSLEVDFARVADLRIIDEDPLYVYRDRGTSTMHFVNLGKALRSHRVRVQVDTLEPEEDKQFFQMIGNAETIAKIRQKNDGPILWTFDYAKRQIMDGNDIIFSERGSIAGSLEEGAQTSVTTPWWSLSAFAALAKGGAIDEAAILAAIADLKHEDTYLRRNARETLAIAGPMAVPALLAAWKEDRDNYRLKLGATYALAEMLRRDPASRAQISLAIPTEDFPLLVDAASDPDKTIRFQAAEFLYLLEDPRSVEFSVEAAKETSDEAVATNQILILRQAGQSLPENEKQQIIQELQAPSSKLRSTILDGESLIQDVLKW